MDPYSQGQQGQGQGQGQTQPGVTGIGQGRDPTEQQQQQRYRHVSAPMQQPHQSNQNMSSFQESLRQDSLTMPSHGMNVNLGMGISVGGNNNSKSSSSGTSGTFGTNDTQVGDGHVGILIEDNGASFRHQYDHSSDSTNGQYLRQGGHGLIEKEPASGPNKRGDHVIVPTMDHQFLPQQQQQSGSSPLPVSSFTVPLPPPPGQQSQATGAVSYPPQQPHQQPYLHHHQLQHQSSQRTPLSLARVDEGKPSVATMGGDHARLDPSSPVLSATAKTLSVPSSFSPGLPLHATSPPGPPVASFMPGGVATGATMIPSAPGSASPHTSGSFSPARYTAVGSGLSGITPSTSSPSRSPVSPVVLQKSSSLRSTSNRTRQLSGKENNATAEADQAGTGRQSINPTPTSTGFAPGYGSLTPSTTHHQTPILNTVARTQLSDSPATISHHLPQPPSYTQQQQQQQPSDGTSPPVKGHSNRNSYTGMFQQGYSQFQGQLPGATLSRHLSMQLSPNSMLLPPPPPALHAGSSPVLHSTISMDGTGQDPSLQSQDHGANLHGTNSLRSQLTHPHQQYQPPQQQQHQHHSGGSPQVPPPTIKYMRSPMMPQLSSQAMAHAQAQSQFQYRQQNSSYPYSPHTSQSNQHFPPRTHRRSIQPLTLDQQQPKGGSFRYVRNQADLWPQKGSQKYRSIDAYGHSVSPLRALTELLTRTYSHCNRDFKYEPSYNPRRVLTKPSKPMHNEGYDNEDYDYILYVSDILGSEERQRYLILDVLGQGTFGQVVKCQNLKTNAIVAVKVIKNKPAYFNQSMMEVTVLELLNERYDMDDRHHILRLQDTFIHRRHLCLVFELLSVNLYELIKQNQFRGLSMSLVRVFSAQLLDALCILNEARIIHCDLKPENVLLKNLETPTIKVIDFGSACHEQQTVYTYIQSRFYRSPEVLVGLPYSSSIDIWSVGCIAAELFLGLPLFPGSSEYNQLCRIVEMLGMPPSYMLEIGKTAHEFFEVSHSFGSSAPKKFRLKSMETYSREHGVVEQPSKRYFQATTLPDIINSYPFSKKGMTQKEIEKETANRRSFINFLQGLLNLNPIERWSPHQAKLHPFITGEPFTGNFVPPMIPKKPTTAENSARLEPTLPGRTSKSRSSSLTSSSSAPRISGKSASSSLAAQGNFVHAQTSSTTLTLDGSSSRSAAVKTKSSGDHLQASSFSRLGDGLGTSSGSSLGSSATDTSSMKGSPIALTPPVASGTAVTSGSQSTGVGFASGTDSLGSPGLQTSNTLPLSAHSHQRPRATTMGTVGVPKNMAQLAAVMTPLQQSDSSPGGVSVSSGQHRVGSNDSLPLSRLEDSDSHRSMKPESVFGLGQIAERSEQNSPVHDGPFLGSGVGGGHRQSTSEGTKQQLQPPHRYLLRSGSDSSGRGNLRSQGMSTKNSSQIQESPKTTTAMKGDDSEALTPLQRMQQQLQMGQSQSQQHQQQQSQQYRYHFGYPQSFGEGSQSGTGTSSSLSSGGTGSDLNSNSSGQLEYQSNEPDFHAAEGTSASASAANRRIFQRMEIARSDSTGTGTLSGGSSIIIDECEEEDAEDEDSETATDRHVFDQDGSDDEYDEDGQVRPILTVVGQGAESESDEAHGHDGVDSSGILSSSVTSDSLQSRSYNSSSISLSDPREEDAILVQGEGSLSASSPGIEGLGMIASSAAVEPASTSASTSAPFVLEEEGEEEDDEEHAPTRLSPPLLATEVAPPSSLDFASPSLDTVQEQFEPADEEESTLISSATTTAAPPFAVPQVDLATAPGVLHVLPEVEEVDEHEEAEAAGTFVQNDDRTHEDGHVQIAHDPIKVQAQESKTETIPVDSRASANVSPLVQPTTPQVVAITDLPSQSTTVPNRAAPELKQSVDGTSLPSSIGEPVGETALDEVDL